MSKIIDAEGNTHEVWVEDGLLRTNYTNPFHFGLDEENALKMAGAIYEAFEAVETVTRHQLQPHELATLANVLERAQCMNNEWRTRVEKAVLQFLP